MTKKIMPVLFSVPINERLELPARAEILPKIESGEIEHLDFDARVTELSRPAALKANGYSKRSASPLAAA